MRPNYNFGDEVRLIRNVRNDGTYPGMDIGTPLVACGSTGHVQSVGTYLQDYIIYGVHFLESDILVGCREEELISIDDKWVPSKYEFRDKVRSLISLGINGEVIVEKGTPGEIEKVLRDMPGGVQYHVRFPGRSLQVPETALEDPAE
jgi:nitrogen fixation protein NifZ